MHIGFSNVVSMDKVVAIISPETVTAKRIRELGRENNTLIDCTMGRKLRSMIVTDSPFTFLSSLRTEALLQRVSSKYEGPGQPEDEASGDTE